VSALQRRGSLDMDAAWGIGHVLRTEKPELHPRIDAASWLARALGAEPGAGLEELSARSCMIVPLSARGHVLGILTLVATSASGRTYEAADLALAQDLRTRTALVLDNARLYQDSKNAVAARDELLAIVSHDLRSPLSTISVCADLLETKLSDDLSEKAAVIQRAARQMDRLIGDLLDLAKIEAGGLRVERQPVEAEELVGEISEMFGTQAAARSQRLECDQGRGLVISCDRGRALQIFSNLIGNAMKFTPDGGTVRLRIERSGEEAIFSVSDSGPGIKAEELPHIFERFWQARKKSQTGVGLGLSIVKALVEAHDGRVWVESQPGKGTTFFFTLPLAQRSESDLHLHA
jgi:signal transduction histidine kinase